ncbi:MAG: transporter [Candidatus Omnitrophota bacterium]
MKWIQAQGNTSTGYRSRQFIRALLIFLIILFVPYSKCFAKQPIDHSEHPRSRRQAKTAGHRNAVVNVNYVYEYERSNDNFDRTNTNELDLVLTYGVLEKVDVIMNMPVKYKVLNGKKHYSGLADLSLEAKWKFYEKDDLHLAVYPQMTFPTGYYRQGEGEGRATYGVMLIATKDIDPVTLSLVSSYTRNENKVDDRRNIWTLYLNGTLRTSENLSLLGSAGIERDKNKSYKKDPIYLTGGFSYAVSKTFSILPSVKVAIRKPETDITFTLGTQWTF